MMIIIIIFMTIIIIIIKQNNIFFLSWTRTVTRNITKVTTCIRSRIFVEYKFLRHNETFG
jgi:hypothetical protein